MAVEGVLCVACAVPVAHTVGERVGEEGEEGEGLVVGEEDSVPGSSVLDAPMLPLLTARILPVALGLARSVV